MSIMPQITLATPPDGEVRGRWAAVASRRSRRDSALSAGFLMSGFLVSDFLAVSAGLRSQRPSLVATKPVRHSTGQTRSVLSRKAASVSVLAALTSSFSPEWRLNSSMKGFVALGEVDYDRGYRKGESEGNATAVRLQIAVDDLDRFITSPQHEASASGVVLCPAFGGERPVLQGVFNLLVDVDRPNRKAMYYRLFFTDQNDNPLTLLGFKDVRGDGGEDVWTATTTLFTRILRGHAPQYRRPARSRTPAPRPLSNSLYRPDIARKSRNLRLAAW